LFAGVPGMQMPVPFYKDPSNDSGMSIYEQVHNASLFSLFLPIANVADTKRALGGRNYTDKEFYHTLLMSNHMESDPWEFADGIRGKVLWHDEYRTQKMYEASANGNQKFGARTFAAAFDPQKTPAPFHNNTCDGCHVRNGSGIPITPTSDLGGGYKLDSALQAPRGFMTTAGYNPFGNGTPTMPLKDYTFTGEIRPMKLVFFDLQRDTTHVDSSHYSEPLAFAASVITNPPRNVQTGDLYYNNKIMNFYGDSFHVTTPGYNYVWNYEAANSNRMVVNAARVNSELNKTYVPQQVKLGAFQTSSTCQLVLPAPTSKPWPSNCDEINDAAIRGATDGGAVGFMLLNGKRLGNLGAMEAIPNAAIAGINGVGGFRNKQIAALVALGVDPVVAAKMAGTIAWNVGTRAGIINPRDPDNTKLTCNPKSPTLTACFIGRFGWIGDRVSLEDQVANAAFIEMGMTSSAAYTTLYPGGTGKSFSASARQISLQRRVTAIPWRAGFRNRQ
jgi:hypothetical protein